jgi:hypothetical protein
LVMQLLLWPCFCDMVKIYSIWAGPTLYALLILRWIQMTWPFLLDTLWICNNNLRWTLVIGWMVLWMVLFDTAGYP